MSEQDERQEQALVGRAKALYAESLRTLDGETRSKLARARAKAVEAAGSKRFAFPLVPPRLVPVAGVLAVALAVVLIWPGPGSSPVTLDGAAVAGDLDILLEGESLELFEELEFYAWLLEQPELVDPDEAGDGSG